MVAVPDPVTLTGVIPVQLSPDGTVSVMVTGPANPFCPAIVIVELADCPVFRLLCEEAEIVKSGPG